ncbi:MAG TPA: hypothetical protein VGC45_10495 [Gryllotalpicola sp.]
MRALGLAAAAVATTAVLLLTTGCASLLPGGAVTPSPPPRGVVQPSVLCSDPALPIESGEEPAPQATRPPAGTVPPGFAPVAAVECGFGTPVTDAAGQWSTMEIRRYEGDLVPLRKALAEPDDPTPRNQLCAAVAVVGPALWLVDATGRAVEVRWPRGVCGSIKPAAGKAIAALDLVSTRVVKQRLMTPKAELDTGCGGALKPDFPAGAERSPETTPPHPSGGEASSAPPAPPADQTPPGPGDTARVCSYATAPGPGLTLGNGTTLPIATFVSGRTLDHEQAVQALAEAAHGGEASACARTATRFGTLQPLTADGEVSGGPYVIELDGCRRVSAHGGPTRVASPRLLAVFG